MYNSNGVAVVAMIMSAVITVAMLRVVIVFRVVNKW